jgi:hypothetical protein
MSETPVFRFRCAIVFSALLGAATLQTPAWGQGVDQLRRRIALLEGAHREALVAAVHSESLRAETHDTIRAGALTVFARSTDGAVRQAAIAAWPTLDSTYGDAASILAELPLVFHRRTHSEEAGIILPQQEGLQRVLMDSTAGVRDITWQLVSAGATTIQGRADSGLRQWLGGATVAGQTGALSHWTRAYEEMVLAPWRSVRFCYLGDLVWCRVALGLAEDSNRVTNWYDAAERRAIVSELSYDALRVQRLVADRCLTMRSDEACVAVLRSLPPNIPLPQPLPAATRLTLLRHAIDLGGHAAYPRLVHGEEAGLEARLAAAAGVSADSLLAGWRRKILAAPPKSVNFTMAAAWSAVAWVTLLALVGLRSTRWR